MTNNAPAGGATVTYGSALSPTVTISASDPDSNGSALTATAIGLPAGLSLAVGTTLADGSLPGIKTWTVDGKVTAAPGTYPVTVAVTDELDLQTSRSSRTLCLQGEPRSFAGTKRRSAARSSRATDLRARTRKP